MAVKLAGTGSSRYNLGQNSDINVTPFVDVMLVLLIVFMVAIPVATLSIKLDLPPATITTQEHKKPTFISILSAGQIVIVNGETGGQQSTTLGSLASSLYTNLGPNAADQSILIRANRTVRYSDFMAVVNQLSADGFYKVSLITEGNGAQAS